MISNVEQRLFRLESEIQALRQWKASVDAQLARLAQQQYAQLPSSGGGSSSSAAYYGCTLSADCPAGSPGTPATGQTVWKVSSGARSTVTANGTVYNDTPNDLPSGSQAILAPNDDGTYTATGKAC